MLILMQNQYYSDIEHTAVVMTLMMMILVLPLE